MPDADLAYIIDDHLVDIIQERRRQRHIKTTSNKFDTVAIASVLDLVQKYPKKDEYREQQQVISEKRHALQERFRSLLTSDEAHGPESTAESECPQQEIK